MHHKVDSCCCGECFTVYQVVIKMCSVLTDSDVVIHRSSRLHLLLCTCSMAGCQTYPSDAELSTFRYRNRKMEISWFIFTSSIYVILAVFLLVNFSFYICFRLNFLKRCSISALQLKQFLITTSTFYSLFTHPLFTLQWLCHLGHFKN